MTQGEGQLIASRLVDRGLIPWDGREITRADLENLSEREVKVLKDIMLCEVESLRNSANELWTLSSGGPKLSRFKIWLRARFKVWLWAHRLSVRLFSAKLRAKTKAMQ